MIEQWEGPSSSNVEGGGICFCGGALPTTNNCGKYDKLFQRKNFDSAIGAVLAERLNELSVVERENILEDIHGVRDTIKEEPDFVAQCLNSLEEEIAKTKGPTIDAYNLAMTLDRNYVQNRAFRLKFLRSEEFDVLKSASRIIHHFYHKLELFGRDKLVKDITFNDLTCEAQESASISSDQYFGSRDVKGRRINFMFPELLQEVSYKAYIQARWYHSMCLSEDELAQRGGIVAVIFGKHSSRTVGLALRWQAILGRAIPLRPVAIHACYVNHKIPSHIRSMLDVLGRRFTLRYRIHLEETVTSCLYTLQSFGIDAATVPINNDGQPRTDIFSKFLKQRIGAEQAREESPKKKNTIAKPISKSCIEVSDTESASSSTGVIPTSKDVLLGKGLKHPGNSALDKIIDSELLSHRQAATQFQKSCIVLVAVQIVQKNGGRFLMRDKETNEWIVAAQNTVRDSVSTRFRKKSQKIRRATRGPICKSNVRQRHESTVPHLAFS